jgi:hypothetical protein
MAARTPARPLSRRGADGGELGNSPVTIEPATSFDSALEQAVASAVAAVDGGGDHVRVLSFLMAQADRLKQQHAEAEGLCEVRLAHKQFRRRWGDTRPADEAGTASQSGCRALVVDDRVPLMERDAGSQAVLSHMRALQHRGYAVSFVVSGEFTPDPAACAALEAAGITCCRPPFYTSVDEVLRWQTQCFDLIYLHRSSNASRYLPTARQSCPGARILYSVADLHHLRLARQAEPEQAK